MLRLSVALFVAVNECSQLNTSITIGMPFDFSSDLDMGRGPELKSDEKSKGIPIVIEIWHGVFYYFFGTRVHFIGASVHVHGHVHMSNVHGHICHTSVMLSMYMSMSLYMST